MLSGVEIFTFFVSDHLKNMFSSLCLRSLRLTWRPGFRVEKMIVNPGHLIVVMVVNTVRNMFLTLSQAILIHVNTLITTSQV